MSECIEVQITHYTLPSGVRGELQVSSDPKLRESGLLKQEMGFMERAQLNTQRNNNNPGLSGLVEKLQYLTNPLVTVSVPDSCSDITSMSLSRSNSFFFDLVFRLTVLRRRRVENMPSPLPRIIFHEATVKYYIVILSSIVDPQDWIKI